MVAWIGQNPGIQQGANNDDNPKSRGCELYGDRCIALRRHPFGAEASAGCKPAASPKPGRRTAILDQAYQKITAAQVANEFDMNGHAAKAKELLQQADKELKEAAEAANKNAK